MKLGERGRLDITGGKAEQVTARGEPTERLLGSGEHAVAVGVGHGRADVLEARRHQLCHLGGFGRAAEEPLEGSPADHGIGLAELGERLDVGVDVDVVEVTERSTPGLAAGTSRLDERVVDIEQDRVGSLHGCCLH